MPSNARIERGQLFHLWGTPLETVDWKTEAEVKAYLIRVIERVYVVAAVLGALASSARFLITGWQPLYAIHLGIALVMLALHWSPPSLVSIPVRIHVAIGIPALVGLSGLYTFGFYGNGLAWIIVACTVAAVFLQLRALIAFALVLWASTVAIGMLFVQKVLTLPVDGGNYIHLYLGWMPIFISTIVLIAIVTTLVFGYKRAIERLLSTTIAQRDIIHHQAAHDPLTGLPNKTLMDDRLAMACERATRDNALAALLFIDLDGYKGVNDSKGHEAGDRVLVEVARRLEAGLRKVDTAARLGGDEFVAVLVDLPDNSDSTPVFNRLIEAAASPVQLGDSQLQVTTSLGITFYPQTEDIDGDQLLRQADQAMYLAKQAGKNRYHVFDAEQDRHLRGRNESLTRIQQALANHEFVLHYQPKVNMRTGEVLGAEALIRWQHPQRGLLPPGVFMPVVEGHPMGFELGEWVLETALAQIESWIADGLRLSVSVNVGAHQLQHPGFVRSLRDLLARHPAVQPGELELEVLETSALEDFQLVTEVMAACRAMGVGFALDDFGTGYSSLTYLKRLPTDLLKIDQSFVRDMLDDPEDLAILQGVLGLSTAFHRHAIAEGVETLAHGEMLLRLGCEWGQGYAIARPMPAADMGRWVRDWRTPPQWLGIGPTGPDRLQAVYVATEYRAWVAATIRRLREPPGAHPAARLPICPLGRWLDEDGRTLLEAAIPGHRIDVLRQQILTLAARVLVRHSAEDAQQVNADIDQLQRLRDQLLSELAVLYT
jgi:diguanylate cyclase (GGDEF)-like protein